MAVTVELSNHYHYQKLVGAFDFSNDTLKIILMDTSFVFDKDAHDTLADVSGAEIATGYGYTQQNKILSNPVVSRSDPMDVVYVSFDDPTWTASGGSIGPFGSAIIYDDTTADDTVVGCIDFGGSITIVDGLSFQPQNIQITESHAS